MAKSFNNARKALYDGISALGVAPSFDQFNKDLDNPAIRQKVYNKFRDQLGDVSSFEEFDQLVAPRVDTQNEQAFVADKAAEWKAYEKAHPETVDQSGQPAQAVAPSEQVQVPTLTPFAPERQQYQSPVAQELQQRQEYEAQTGSTPMIDATGAAAVDAAMQGYEQAQAEAAQQQALQNYAAAQAQDKAVKDAQYRSARINALNDELADLRNMKDFETNPEAQAYYKEVEGELSQYNPQDRANAFKERRRTALNQKLTKATGIEHKGFGAPSYMDEQGNAVYERDASTGAPIFQMPESVATAAAPTETFRAHTPEEREAARQRGVIAQREQAPRFSQEDVEWNQKADALNRGLDMIENSVAGIAAPGRALAEGGARVVKGIGDIAGGEHKLRGLVDVANGTLSGAMGMIPIVGQWQAVSETATPAVQALAQEIGGEEGQKTASKVMQYASALPFGFSVVLAQAASDGGQQGVKYLLENSEVGKAMPQEDRDRLVEAAGHVGFFGALGLAHPAEHAMKSALTNKESVSHLEESRPAADALRDIRSNFTNEQLDQMAERVLSGKATEKERGVIETLYKLRKAQEQNGGELDPNLTVNKNVDATKTTPKSFVPGFVSNALGLEGEEGHTNRWTLGRAAQEPNGTKALPGDIGEATADLPNLETAQAETPKPTEEPKKAEPVKESVEAENPEPKMEKRMVPQPIVEGGEAIAPNGQRVKVFSVDVNDQVVVDYPNGDSEQFDMDELDPVKVEKEVPVEAESEGKPLSAETLAEVEKVRAEEGNGVPEKKESWQMTKSEYASSDNALPEEYHRNAVISAFTEGKPVPENVLAEYPELENEGGDQNGLQEKGQGRDEVTAPETAIDAINQETRAKTDALKALTFFKKNPNVSLDKSVNLHDQLDAPFSALKPQEHPRVELTGGMSGAGKTTIAVDESKRDYVDINSDNWKPMLSTPTDSQAEKDARHRVSSELANIQLQRALDEKYNIHYDSTLSDYSRAKNIIDRTLKNGGSVRVKFTDVDWETSAARTMARDMIAAKKGEPTRPVGDEQIAKSYNRSLPTVLQLMKDYAGNPLVEFNIYDNNVDHRQPKLVYTRINGKETIHDPERFESIAKVPYIATEGGKYYEREQSISGDTVLARRASLDGRARQSVDRSASDVGIGSATQDVAGGARQDNGGVRKETRGPQSTAQPGVDQNQQSTPTGGEEQTASEEPHEPNSNTQSEEPKQKSKLDEAYDELDDLYRQFAKSLGQMNSGISPEQLMLGMKLVGKSVEIGVREFAEIVKNARRVLGEEIARRMLVPLKQAYAAYFMQASPEEQAKLTPLDAINRFEYDSKISDITGERQQKGASNDSGKVDAIAGSKPGDSTTAGKESVRSGSKGVAGVGNGNSIGAVDSGVDVADAEQAAGSSLDDGKRRPAEVPGADDKESGRLPQRTDGVGDGVREGDGEGANGVPGGSERTGRGDNGGTGAVAGNVGGSDQGNDRRPVAAADRNFVIEEQDLVRKPSINANIEAIELLLKLEKENRNASPEEKRILDHYTGWGGFPQVFDDVKAAQYEKGFTDSSVKNWAKSYYKQYQTLKNILTPEERQTAIDSTINAHYTDRRVVKSLWDFARHLGFRGGTVLEPGTGIGGMLGLLPQQFADATTLLGVELDSISARIAQKLYPEAHIQNVGLQDAKFGRYAEGNPHVAFADLVIGNVPFAREGVYFKTNDPQSYGSLNPDINNHSLHDQFIIRGLDALRPGGIQIVITSMGSMDKDATHSRDEMAKRADLVAAIRLPNTSFEENAKTSVTTDILIFRKKDGKPHTDTMPFKNTVKLKTVKSVEMEQVKGKEPKNKMVDVWVNEYFANNPAMMLGDMGIAKQINDDGTVTDAGGLYSGSVQTLHAKPGVNILESLEKINSDVLPAAIMGEGEYNGRPIVVREEADEDAKHGSFEIKDGLIYQVVNGSLEPNPDFLFEEHRDDKDQKTGYFVDKHGKPTEDRTKAMPHKRAEKRKLRVTMFVPLRDSIKNLRDLEQTPGVPEEEIEQERKNLNRLYDAFVKKTGGAVGSNENTFMEDDPEFSLVLGLEKKDKVPVIDKGKRVFRTVYTKDDIFTKRIGFPFEEPTKADSIEDGMLISLAYRGSVDADYIGGLLDMSKADVERGILESGLGFKDPMTGIVESKFDYLSGFTRKKLREAKVVAEQNPEYQRNVDALQAIVPKDIPLSQIRFQLGSSWIPPHQIEAFIEHALGVKTKVTHSAIGNSFDIAVTDNESASDPRNTLDFAAHGKIPGATRNPHMDALDIIRYTVNSQAPKVTYQIADEHGQPKTVTDPTTTAIAQQRAEKLDEMFQAFLKADPKFEKELFDTYNDKYNSLVLKDYYIPSWQKYPNATVTLRGYQKKVVSRALTLPTLIAHFAGAGKTFEAATICMEARRLKIARKPMIAVQNSTLMQFAEQFRQLYPTAKILCPSDKQRSARERKKTIARIITGDWDAVIIPKSFFDLIEDDPKRVESEIMAEIGRMREAILQYATEDGMKAEDIQQILAGGPNPRGTSPRVKDVVRKINAMYRRMKEMADKKVDKTMTFEQLGIDYLIVDEAHDYKKLGFTTSRQGIKGIDTLGNVTSFSLNMKVKHVFEKTGNKNVVLMTGTPITNTLAEAWTYMRYLRPDILDEMNLRDFDSFANDFGRIATDYEYSMVGTYEAVNRFRGLINSPEFIAGFRSMADVILDSEVKDQLKDMPEEAKGVSVTLKQTIGLRRMIEGFRNTINAYKNATPVYRRSHSHIPITIFTEAKKAAIDLRLIDQTAMDYADSKTNVGARNIFDIWKNERQKYYPKEMNATQLVFCDLRNSREPWEIGQEVRIRQEEPTVTADGAPVAKKKGAKKEYRPARIQEIFWGTIITETEKEIEKQMAKIRYLDGAHEEAEVIIDPATFKLKEGAKSKAFDLYADMRNKLIAMGVPADEIVIIDQQSDKKKIDLFEKVRSGAIRIVFGHTQKLGIGVNVQDRLFAIHHLDAPSMPYLLEQRIKRMIRSGNMFGMKDHFRKVRNITYGVERSLDATAFDKLVIKQKGTDQVLGGKITDRHGDDTAGELQLSVQEIQEGLTGDPRVPIRNGMERKIQDMERRKQDATDSAARAKEEIRKITENQIPYEKNQVKFYEAAAKEAGDVFPDGNIHTLEYNGETVSDLLTDAQKEQARSEIRTQHPELEKESPEKFEKKVETAIKAIETKNRAMLREAVNKAIESEYGKAIDDFLNSDNYPHPKDRYSYADYHGQIVVNGKPVNLTMTVWSNFNDGQHIINVPEQLQGLTRKGTHRSYLYQVRHDSDLSGGTINAEIAADPSYGGVKEKRARLLLNEKIVSGNSLATHISKIAEKMKERKERSLHDIEQAEKELVQFKESLVSKWSGEDEKALEKLQNEYAELVNELSKGRSDKSIYESTWEQVKKEVAPMSEEEQKRERELWVDDVKSAIDAGKYSAGIADGSMTLNEVREILEDAGLESHLEEIKAAAEKDMTERLRGRERVQYEMITKSHPHLADAVRSNPRATDEELQAILKQALRDDKNTEQEDLGTALEHGHFGKALVGVRAFRDAVNKFDREGYDPNATVRLSKGAAGLLGPRTVYGQRNGAHASDYLGRGNKVNVSEVERDAKRLTGWMKNAPEVKVYGSLRDVPDQISRSMDQTTNGLYWRSSNGRDIVFIVADQIKDMDDLNATLLHEIVGHYGLRKTLGGSFDKVLDTVWNDYSEKIKGAEWFGKYANDPQYDPSTAEGRRALAEEYVAYEFAAKNTPEPSLLDRIVMAIRRFFRTIGMELKTSAAEIRKMVADSRKFVKGEKEAAEGAENQSETVRASKGNPNDFYNGETGGSVFTDPVKRDTAVDKFIRAHQDHLIDLKRAQARIERIGGVELPDNQNAYRTETLAYGRTNNELKNLEAKHWKPILELIAAAKKHSNVTLDDIRNYMAAKHVPELNQHFRDLYADIIANTTDQNRLDELNSLSGWTDSKADTVLDRLDREGKTQVLGQIARKFYAMNREDLNRRLAAGLITPEYHDELVHKFGYYMPFKGFAESDADETMPRVGRGANIKGPEYKAAKGRAHSEFGDILSYAYQQAQEGIVRAEKNRIARAFYNFVVKNPDKGWEVVKYYYEAMKDENGNLRYDENQNKMYMITTRKPTKVQLETGSAKYHINPQNEVAIGFKESGLDADNILGVKIDGKTKFIRIADVNLARGLKKMDMEQMGAVTQNFGKFINLYKRLTTSYAPYFLFRNPARDAAEASFYLTAELGEGAAPKVLAHVPQAAAGLIKHNAGKYTNDYAVAAREFHEEGGQTAFNDIGSIEQKKKALEQAYKRMGRFSVKEKVEKALDYLEAGNKVMENGIRLATYYYCTRELGWSKPKAAEYAKNITVNFNRHGNSSGPLGAYFAFFNPSIQGSAKLVGAMTSEKKTIRNKAWASAAILFGLGFGMSEFARWWMGKDEDDEDYIDKEPIWSRHHKLLIPNFAKGNGEMIGLPLPPGLNIFPAIGASVSDAVHGKMTGPKTAGILGTIVDAFNPIGSSESKSFWGTMVKSFTPTILRPISEMAMNENFTARNIHPNRIPGAIYEKPNSQTHYANTNPVFVKIAEALNEATGGDEAAKGWIDWYPDNLQYFFGFYTAGLGRFGVDVVTSADQLVSSDKELDPRNIPFLNQFTVRPSTATDRQKFRENEAAIETVKKQLEAAEDSGDKDKEWQIKEENAALLSLTKPKKPGQKRGTGEYEKVKHAINLLDKEEADTDDPRRKSEIEQEKTSKMKQFNRSVKNAKDLLE